MMTSIIATAMTLLLNMPFPPLEREVEVMCDVREEETEVVELAFDWEDAAEED